MDLKPLFVLLYLVFTLPLAWKPPTVGNSLERCGQTAGVIRMYCKDPTLTFLQAPQVHFGNRPFNMELSMIEWLQGKAARLADAFGSQKIDTCEHVETIAKLTSIFFSALAVWLVGALTQLIGNQYLRSSGAHSNQSAGLLLWASNLASALLAGNELWLRYGTYTMVENRALCFGLLALFFSYKKRPVLGFLFWGFTLLQKPQIFLFTSAIWIAWEGIFLLQSMKESSQNWIQSLLNYVKPRLRIYIVYFFAATTGILFLRHSLALNEKSDLPWITWHGPRHLNWFFGQWEERLSFDFWKGLFFHWLHRSEIIPGLAISYVMSVLLDRGKRGRFDEKSLYIIFVTMPFFFAVALLTGIFLQVFKAHEYYALPLCVFSGIGGALFIFIHFQYNVFNPKKEKFYAIVFALAVLLSVKDMRLGTYLNWYSRALADENSLYDQNFGRKIFPNNFEELPDDPRALVVFASNYSQRDLLLLYLHKKHGFQWCTKNRKYAPRRFWKDSGVKFVAWAVGQDLNTGLFEWEVHSIDEEMEQARKEGWSADRGPGERGEDVWGQRTMDQWANIASHMDLDPCREGRQQDPRTW